MIRSLCAGLLMLPALYNAGQAAAPSCTAPAGGWAAIAGARSNVAKPGYKPTPVVACGMTKEEVVGAAMARCRAGAPSDATCGVLTAFTRGCGFVSAGTTPEGQNNMASHLTPQSTYDLCHKQGLNCDTNVAWVCIAPAKPPMSVDWVTPADPIPEYLAVAGGLYDGGPGYRVEVSVGVGTGPTAAAAGAAARTKCETAGDDVRHCDVVKTVVNGCTFIARGMNPTTKQVRWAVGSSRQDAYNRCSADGYNCGASAAQIPGGCVGKMD